MWKKYFPYVFGTSSRLVWIDYAKAIAIILVVYRHIMIGLQRAGLDVHPWYVMANEMVFSFRMPLFFILSGLFIIPSIKKRGSLPFVRSKFNTILYPYLIWAFIQVSIQIVFSRYTNADRSWIDYWYILSDPRRIDQFWFLYCLFNTNVLFLLLYNAFRGNRILLVISSILLFLFANYGWYFVDIPGLFKDMFNYQIFVVVGVLISKQLTSKENFPKLSSYRLLILLTPFFLVSQWLWINNLDFFNQRPYLFIWIALLGCFYIFNISMIIFRVREANFLRVAGYHSLYIYLLHVIVSAGARIVLINQFGIQNTAFLMITGIILGTVIPIFVYRFALKYNLGWMFNPPGTFNRSLKSSESSG